jgi:hypothetical protein
MPIIKAYFDLRELILSCQTQPSHPIRINTLTARDTDYVDLLVESVPGLLLL